MIRLKKKTKNIVTSDADYVLEKFEKFDQLIDMLTPKFEGNWQIIMFDPKLTLIKDLVTIKKVPDWVDITIYTSEKKIENIVLEFPSLQPKEVTAKDRFEEIVKSVTTVITSDASKLLFNMFKQQPDEVEEVLRHLDKDPEVEKITKKELTKSIVYVKRTYVSDVLLAFIENDPRRWQLYSKVHAELGTDITYYAMYKYATKLLQEKSNFLKNEDVKIYAVRRIDAAIIDYIYILFANSTSSNQLITILHAIENRCKEMLDMFTES